MSETPETKESCEAKGGTWNAEAGTCTLPPKEPEAPAEKALLDRIMGVMEDTMKMKLAGFEKEIDQKIETILKAKEIEVEQALRKGLGLNTEQPLTTGDIPSLIDQVRKAALENAPPQGKTPLNPKEKAGPNGAEDPFDLAVKAKLEGLN